MTPPSNELAARAVSPLLALNFFMADMQAGIGPFLGVFLLAHGWQSGLIGIVMTQSNPAVHRFRQRFVGRPAVVGDAAEIQRQARAP